MALPIKKHRKKLGITQKALAAYLGVSLSSVVNWENGKISPKGKNLAKVELFLGLSKDAPKKTSIPINKLSKFAIEELIDKFKEEYVEYYLGETDYEGNTFDEDIVRGYSEIESEIIQWCEDYYEESWEEIICNKIDQLKKGPKELTILIKVLNKEIEKVTKYASYFGYEDK